MEPSLKNSTFTVNDAAKRFSRTTARIRQICIAEKIGNLIFNRIRILSARDVQKIGKIIGEKGRNRDS